MLRPAVQEKPQLPEPGKPPLIPADIQADIPLDIPVDIRPVTTANTAAVITVNTAPAPTMAVTTATDALTIIKAMAAITIAAHNFSC